MTTTINIANIKVGMDVSELRKGGGFARGELASLTKMFKDAETGTQKFERDLELLQRAFVSSGGAIKNYEQIVDMLETKHGLAAQSAKELAAEEAKLAHTMRAAGLGIKENAALFSTEQLDRLGKMSEQAMSPLQKLHREVQALDRAFELGKMDIQVYNNLLAGLEKQYGLTAIHAKKAADAELARAHAQRAAGLGITSGAAGFTTEELDVIAKMARQAGGPIEDLRNKVALLDKAFASGMSEDAYNATLKHLIDSSGIYAQQTKKAAEEQSRLNALIESVRTPFEKYSEELKYVNEQHAAGKIDAMQHAAAVQNLAKRYGEFHPVLAATAAKIPTGKMGLFSNDELKALGQFDVPSAKPSAGSIEFLQQNMALVKAFKSGAYTADQYDAALVDLHKRFGILALTEEDLIGKQERLWRAQSLAAQALRQQDVQANGAGVSLRGLAARFVGLNEAVQLIKRGFSELADYFKESIVLAAKMQTASISFEVLTKSAKESGLIMRELRDLSKGTPIPFAEHAQGAKMLLGTRVAAEQVKPTLESLAAISLGNTETFQGLVKAFSDVSAAGRLTGQEMLQFRNAGFNPLNEISRTTGISMRELKKIMEDGGISFEMLNKSIMSATTSGGLFAGMNDRLMKSTQGQFNQLANSFQQVQIVVGEQLGPAAVEVAKLLKDMFDPEKPSMFKDAVVGLGLSIGSLAAWIRGGNEGIKEFINNWLSAEQKARKAREDAKKARESGASDAANKERELSDEELKLIKRNKDAFLDKIRTANEEYEKSLFFNPRDDKSYEKAMLRRDAAGQSPQDRIAAERAIIQITDASSREQLNAVIKQTSEAKDRFDIEKRMVEARKKFPLLDSQSVEEYASLEKTFQMRAETIAQATKDRIALLEQERKQGKFDDTGVLYFDLVNKEKEAYRQHIKELKGTMNEATQTLFEKARLKLASTAEELNKKFNPAQTLRQELSQLELMRQQNMITQNVFDRQAMELGQQAREAMGILPNIAPALKEGSAEAYKFILEQNAKSQERWEIKKLNEQMLKELKTANQQNANAPRLAQAR